ncbi:hypothetical protein [Thermoactinospora rubra]|uniref:hypothetical protein n=1 Tax=Thermoactinospora rubra TaxID=1088767 RepID=UPI00117E5C1D|nr:hypothetical protein [Thermoactinospora rubra]
MPDPTAALDEVLAGLRSGQGGALVVRGAGTSRALELAASRAEGVRVLRVAGTGSWVAFDALGRLLVPVADLVGQVSRPRRDALLAALGRGTSPTGDPFLVFEGVREVLALAAEPLLCLVDGYQALDRSSADALAYCARRLSGVPVGMLLAVEDPPGTAKPPEEQPEPPEEQPEPPEEQPEPREEQPEARLWGVPELRLPPPEQAPSLTGLIGGLSDSARLAGLIAAVEARGDLSLIVQVAQALDTDPLALEEVRTAGLVTFRDGALAFAHPLARTALIETATPVRLRGVHAALAGLLPAGEERAWHLAEAAEGPDELVARELTAAARRMRERAGHADAALALRRAADLTPDPRAGERRLADAAMAAWHGGRPAEAVRHLAGLSPPDADGRLREDVLRIRGLFELNCGDAAKAVQILTAGRSLDTLADAADAAAQAGQRDALVEIGRRAQEFKDSFERDVLVGIGALEEGDARRGSMALRSALRRSDELTRADQVLRAWAASVLVEEEHRDLLHRAVRMATVTAFAWHLPAVLEHLAAAQLRDGDLTAAEATSSRGLELAREAGYSNVAAGHLANLAAAAALRGDAAACRELAREALDIAVPHRLAATERLAREALEKAG